MVTNGPNIDVPTLPRPKHGETIDGPVGQYSRKRFLDMDQIAQNLLTFKKLLEDGKNNWQRTGIPTKLKVSLIREYILIVSFES